MICSLSHVDTPWLFRVVYSTSLSCRGKNDRKKTLRKKGYKLNALNDREGVEFRQYEIREENGRAGEVYVSEEQFGHYS